MIVSGIMKEPINVKEPYQVLGVGATPNGYDVGYICSNLHGKINEWSRHKPVPGAYPGLSVLYPGTGDESFLGYNGKAGMNVFDTNDVTTLAKYVLSKNVGDRWNYIPPKGGKNEPFRITDFIDYYHNSIKPLFFMSSYSGVHTSDIINLRLYHSYDSRAPFDSLFITDLKLSGSSLRDWYLAGIFINGSTNEILGCGCNQYPLGNPLDFEDKFGRYDDPFVLPVISTNHGFTSKINHYVIPILSKKKHDRFFELSQIKSDDLFCDLPVDNAGLYFYNLLDAGFYINENNSYYDNVGMWIEIWARNTLDREADLGSFRVEVWTWDVDDRSLTHKVGTLSQNHNYKLAPNTEDSDTREGGMYNWGRYSLDGGFSINQQTAYNTGYFIKLIGDEPNKFPPFTSRRIRPKQ